MDYNDFSTDEDFFRCKLLVENFDEFPDGIFILDKQWIFIYLNKTAAGIVGLKPKDIIGKNLWSAFPEVKGTLMEEKYRLTMQDKQARHFEMKGIGAETCFDIAVYPSSEGILVNWRDITMQEKAKEALQNSEQLFRLVAEAAKVMVYEIKVGEDAVKLYRGEDVLGYEPGEIPASNIWWFNQMHPDDRAIIEQKSKEAIEAGRDALLEYRIKRKQGDYIIVHDTAKMVKDKHGNVVRIVGGVRDVTERKKGEEALREAQAKLKDYTVSLERLVEIRTKQLTDAERLAAIGQTAGMVGHDIRNPLQAMMSDVYLLKDFLKAMPEMPTKTEVRESLDELECNISYINKIVADLQDYARPLNPEYTCVVLSDVIASVFKTVVLPESIKLSIDVKTIPEIRTEPTFVRRALTNLINNAIQAMPDGGNLTINVFESNGTIEVTVADTGVGIPEEVKPKLFTPMMTTKAKGQGLGLAVVKRLIEAINGTISFESQKDKGTIFIIKLPTDEKAP